ncbi:histone deacetylase family protein [Aureimonas frigidaquae]|uniref:histone deacetylase family protein n=1 Tax=Aureimonas frigidaquae TaxID=424757 RepID=UPI0007803A67|nr:histone deacetylase family protein [Aureimonas frigidaquae]
MELFFDTRQLNHRPTQYLVHGRIVAPLEKPERFEVMRDALLAAGLLEGKVQDSGSDPIRNVHAPHYVAFLETAVEAFAALPNAGPELLPNVHPYAAGTPGLRQRPAPRTTGILGRAGWYIGDMSCAMMAGTFEAAYWSAQSALSAATAVAEGADCAFALCRPPGHHAYADRASGFCFFNNAALAAERLRRVHDRVAILDFDTHHGDGTQAIFYERADVLFASTHTDPQAYYPHYFGYADETGEGEGRGFNLNIPLAPGSDDDHFVGAVERLAERVLRHAPGALVLSAGWDAHRNDPLSRLDVGTQAFSRIGKLLGGLNLPTVIVQEGGYSLDAVAEAAPAFMTAFRSAR